MACKKGQAIQEMTKPERLPENEIGEWEVTAKLLCCPYQFSTNEKKVKHTASSMTKLGNELFIKCKGPD